MRMHSKWSCFADRDMEMTFTHVMNDFSRSLMPSNERSCANPGFRKIRENGTVLNLRSSRHLVLFLPTSGGRRRIVGGTTLFSILLQRIYFKDHEKKRRQKVDTGEKNNENNELNSYTHTHTHTHTHVYICIRIKHRSFCTMQQNDRDISSLWHSVDSWTSAWADRSQW